MIFKPETCQRINKNLLIFGLFYSVLWTVIIYFIWEDSPEIFLILDILTDIVLLHLVYRIYMHRDLSQRRSGYLGAGMRLVQLFSLAYATIWTIILMFTLQIGEFLLPLDFISLYATIGLTMPIWKAQAAVAVDVTTEKHMIPGSGSVIS